MGKIMRNGIAYGGKGKDGKDGNVYVYTRAEFEAIKDTIPEGQIFSIVDDTPVSPTNASRKIITICDSYGGRNNDGNLTTIWEKKLQELMNLTENVDYWYSWYGGAGFKNGNYLEQLKWLADDTTSLTPEGHSDKVASPKEITDIIVVGGGNDASYNKTDITNSIKTFAEYAKEKFPNAKIKLAHVYWSHSSTNYLCAENSIPAYKKASVYVPNVCYLGNTEYILHKYKDIWQNDGFHPNQEGHDLLAGHLANAIETGQCNINEYEGDTDFTMITGGLFKSILSGHVIHLENSINNNITTLKVSVGQVICDDTKILNFSADSPGASGWIDLCGVSLNYINSWSSNRSDWIFTTINVSLSHDGGSTAWMNLPVTFRIFDGKLQMYVMYATNSAYMRNVKITALIFPPIVFNFDTLFV